MVLDLPVLLLEGLTKSLHIGSDWDLMWLGFKVIILLFIISFVRTRFQGGPIIITLILIIGYLFLFEYWTVFGPIMIVYFAITFGFTMVFYDLAITRPWAGGHGGGHEDSSHDMQERLGKMRGGMR